MITIRKATSDDDDAIRTLYLEAFPSAEAPVVAKLALDLLHGETAPETISLVAETTGSVIGHIAFSPVSIETRASWQGFILAPLAVHPGHRKRRIGTRLVEAGLEQLAGSEVDVVFVYGDPRYYNKFGFDAGAAAGYLPPCELQYPFGWQAIALRQSDRVDPATRIACVAALNDPSLW